MKYKTIINSLQLQFKRGLFKSWPKRMETGNFDLVELGQISTELPVPDHIKKPPYYFEETPPGNTLGESEIKNADQINRMRLSCKLAANVLQACGKIIEVGISTDEIDAFVHDKIIKNNAYPSPLRYAGFPKSCCTSVNNVACHGIPDDRKLKNGDIINVDITVYLNGYHGDCSKTFLVGDVDETGRYLVENTEKCLNGAINICKAGKEINAIGKFIHKFSKENGLTVIPSFIGHGIGSQFHAPPEILHYYNNFPGIMKSGMTFTIEPILGLGQPDIEIQDDNWTAITCDNTRSAQFEHTILITDNHVEILTQPD